MKKSLLFVILATLQVPLSFATDISDLKGEWRVVDTGADCVSTGWVTDTYELQNGKISGVKVTIGKNKLNWGKQSCQSPVFSLDKESTLEFFDGSACRTSPGILPKSCADLMNEQKGKKVKRYTFTCKGSVTLPESLTVLSKDELLATAEADYVCLRRVH